MSKRNWIKSENLHQDRVVFELICEPGEGTRINLQTDVLAVI